MRILSNHEYPIKVHLLSKTVGYFLRLLYLLSTFNIYIYRDYFQKHNHTLWLILNVCTRGGDTCSLQHLIQSWRPIKAAGSVSVVVSEPGQSSWPDSASPGPLCPVTPHYRHYRRYQISDHGDGEGSGGGADTPIRHQWGHQALVTRTWALVSRQEREPPVSIDSWSRRAYKY